MAVICVFAEWVERSETHQAPASVAMGFASLYPSYGPANYTARFADTRPHVAITAIASEISTL
jgi:hypothetical protein